MPAAEAPRHELAAALTAVLPAEWKIVPYQRNVDRLTQTVVMFKQEEIARHPDAPQGALEISMTMTIASPLTDPASAEDELDDDVLALTMALTRAGIKWGSAKKVLFNTDQLGYDIDIKLTASLTPTTPQEETP